MLAVAGNKGGSDVAATEDALADLDHRQAGKAWRLAWDIFVVQVAAFLDRLTFRRVIALIPLVIIILAYEHNIPLPPELMLVGDLLAYLDIVSVLLLFSILSRVSTILFVVNQIVARVMQLMITVRGGLRRLDVRHRRVGGRRRQLKGGQSDDDGCPVVYGLAWA